MSKPLTYIKEIGKPKGEKCYFKIHFTWNPGGPRGWAKIVDQVDPTKNYGYSLLANASRPSSGFLKNGWNALLLDTVFVVCDVVASAKKKVGAAYRIISHDNIEEIARINEWSNPEAFETFRDALAKHLPQLEGENGNPRPLEDLVSSTPSIFKAVTEADTRTLTDEFRRASLPIVLHHTPLESLLEELQRRGIALKIGGKRPPAPLPPKSKKALTEMDTLHKEAQSCETDTS